MTLIELPRALEDYFAFAETEATRRGRRFSISLPYFSCARSGARVHRLQWWYHVTPAQELMYDGTGLIVFRRKAVERFRRHIERWLESTGQHLHGEGPIPQVTMQMAAVPAASAKPTLKLVPEKLVSDLNVDRVVNG